MTSVPAVMRRNFCRDWWGWGLICPCAAVYLAMQPAGVQCLCNSSIHSK